jgi:uncharacterized membrane protein YkvA (DUF1232 family)
VHNVWSALIWLLLGVAVFWVALVLALWLAQRRLPDAANLKETLRVLPDLVRLLRRLAVDRSLPRSARWALVALVGYLLLPIDLVPDFIPVLGYADDAIMVALVLRYLVRTAGSEVVTRHWSGSAAGLQAVRRLAGIPGAAERPPGAPQ